MELKRLTKHIRTLASLPVEEAEVISCYLGLDGNGLKDKAAFSAQLGGLQQGMSETVRQDAESALQRIDEYLATELSPQARGVALFSRAGKTPFFLPLQFLVPLPTWVAVDTTPNLYHLVELKDNYHRYVVMISTEESVRILEVNLGAVTEELWRDRPELRKRVGREWTKDHYQSHRRDRTQKFVKEQIQFLSHRMQAGGYTHLILAGNPKITAQVQEVLPRHLADKLVDIVPASGRTPISDVLRASIASFIRIEENESRAVADTVVRMARSGGLAVVGTLPTFQALELGCVDTLVLAQSYQPNMGWHCTACGTMQVEPERLQECPHCEAGELREFDVKEEMVRLAEQDKCGVEVVERSDPLSLHGGAGCLLRYRTPASYGNAI